MLLLTIIPHCFVPMLLVLRSWHHLFLIEVEMLVVISVGLVLGDFAYYLQMVLLLEPVVVLKYISVFLKVGV